MILALLIFVYKFYVHSANCHDASHQQAHFFLNWNRVVVDEFESGEDDKTHKCSTYSKDDRCQYQYSD